MQRNGYCRPGQAGTPAVPAPSSLIIFTASDVRGITYIFIFGAAVYNFVEPYVECWLSRILVQKEILGVAMGKGSLSYAATVILQAISSGYLYGFDITDITGLPGERSTPRCDASRNPVI